MKYPMRTLFSYSQSDEELDCGEHMKDQEGFVCVCNSDGYVLEADGKTCSGLLVNPWL